MEKSPLRIILLVDDDERFLAVLANELRNLKSNLSFMTAENGEKALKILESKRVDLVVTDLRMPEMNGFALLSHIKRNYPHIPVIVMSSFLDPEEEAGLWAIGALHCIDKSNIDTLEEMITKSWQEVQEGVKGSLMTLFSDTGNGRG